MFAARNKKMKVVLRSSDPKNENRRFLDLRDRRTKLGVLGFLGFKNENKIEFFEFPAPNIENNKVIRSSWTEYRKTPIFEEAPIFERTPNFGETFHLRKTSILAKPPSIFEAE